MNNKRQFLANRLMRSPTASKGLLVSNIVSFLLGCFLCTSLMMLWVSWRTEDTGNGRNGHGRFTFSQDQAVREGSTGSSRSVGSRVRVENILQNQRILVALASFDFSQLPHLEEVLSSYRDICEAGAAQVDVYIHTTMAYPVALIDLLNTRLQCTSTTHPDRHSHNNNSTNRFHIYISIRSPAVRLNLVNFHRSLFYDNLDKYDLFIYSEDDIRVTPTTVAAYLYETQLLRQELQRQQPKSNTFLKEWDNEDMDLQASNYNVGVVRYEYNYPPDIIIEDKTRHATKNVTRVYWEHPWKPPIPKSVDSVPSTIFQKDYVYMTNHHQGMFLATSSLLRQWRDRPGCNFDIVRPRPSERNNPSQPSEGTQRVWMSSQMLYGKSHCNVQQILPIDRFGSLNVLHLPNKNYRRLGKKGRLGGTNNSPINEFSNSTTAKVKYDNPLLLTAMELHIELEKHFPSTKRKRFLYPQQYTGVITMINELYPKPSFNNKEKHLQLVEKRMKAYKEYIQRGGIMSKEDMEGASRHSFFDEEEF